MINDLWYKNAIVYCLSVGTYMDANGDGIGDFQGLMRRLDYLHGLGVTAVWLMPFQQSPGKDDGYDISDYYSVNPAFGTLGDFVEFTHAAKQRGIRVLIDLVVNHTSWDFGYSLVSQVFAWTRSLSSFQRRDRKSESRSSSTIFCAFCASFYSGDRATRSSWRKRTSFRRQIWNISAMLAIECI
jgi:maltose alpha-D-glucosyltransferase/alpha-amylase